MNAERELRRIFDRLYKMGVASAFINVCDEENCAGCGVCIIDSDEVLRVLGEMMNVATPGITIERVLDAAKKAGVY